MKIKTSRKHFDVNICRIRDKNNKIEVIIRKYKGRIKGDYLKKICTNNIEVEEFLCNNFYLS